MKRAYDDIAKEVDAITDDLGLPIDAGIKKVVIALRLWNFPTDGSCEGHLSNGLPYPWVEIYAPEQEETSWRQENIHQRERLTRLLSDFYKTGKFKHRFTCQNIGMFGGFRLISEQTSNTSKPNANSINAQRQDFDSFADFLVDNLQ